MMPAADDLLTLCDGVHEVCSGPGDFAVCAEVLGITPRLHWELKPGSTSLVHPTGCAPPGPTLDDISAQGGIFNVWWENFGQDATLDKCTRQEDA
jgi:hypothetical protein